MKFVEPITDEKTIRMIITKTEKERDKILLALGFYTGLRIADILKLRFKDIVDKNILRITEQKTKKQNIVTIPEKLNNLIKAYSKNRDRNDYILTSQMKTKDGKSKPITSRQASNIIKKACEREGVNRVVACHTLRKSLAVIYFKKTNDIHGTMKLLNHSNINQTIRYLNLFQEQKEEVIKGLEFL